MVVNIRIIVFFDVTLCSLKDITILEEIAASAFMAEDGGNRFFQNGGTQYKVT